MSDIISPFLMQKAIMQDLKHTTRTQNTVQYDFYISKIKTLTSSLLPALEAGVNPPDDAPSVVEVDKLLYIIGLCIGALESMGSDPEGSWESSINIGISKDHPYYKTIKEIENFEAIYFRHRIIDITKGQ